MAAVLMAVSLAACKTVSSTRFQTPDTPIACQFVSKVIDEESIDYTVKFRNTGQQVVSFDYTIIDEPGIPHVDSMGPNSGLIENLYPGAQVQVKNPLKSRRGVQVALGRLTYGKKTADELARLYRPETIRPVPAGATDTLPLLEPISAPGQ